METTCRDRSTSLTGFERTSVTNLPVFGTTKAVPFLDKFGDLLAPLPPRMSRTSLNQTQETTSMPCGPAPSRLT